MWVTMQSALAWMGYMSTSDTAITNRLKRRILEISYEHKLSHLCSCLNVLPTIYNIFKKKREADKFILSNGHSALAYYVVLEHFFDIDAVRLLETHGIHPVRDLENKIDVSTGSLGLGLPIAVGYAMACPSNDVYCIISDGECAEGSIWESLMFANRETLTNLHVYCIVNGQSAYQTIDSNLLIKQLRAFLPSIHIVNESSVLTKDVKGLLSHYHAIKTEKELNDMIMRNCPDA